jgi:hypothetical protein
MPKDQKLSLSGNAELISKMTSDFVKLAAAGAKQLPSKRIYIIKDDVENDAIKRSARKAALRKLAEPIVKKAIDSRRINQKDTRNPRRSLQYYHRSDQFISEDVQNKLDVFSKVMHVLEGIKESYGKENAYHDSYARELYGHVERALRLKIADGDIHEPQLAYLEQLIYARYRLSLEQISRMNDVQIKKAILNKDEDLIRRGVYLEHTGGLEKNSTGPLVIDGNKSNTQQNIVEAIFGNNDFRRDGEKKVERTITITIKDEVKD